MSQRSSTYQIIKKVAGSNTTGHWTFSLSDFAVVDPKEGLSKIPVFLFPVVPLGLKSIMHLIGEKIYTISVGF